MDKSGFTPLTCGGRERAILSLFGGWDEKDPGSDPNLTLTSVMLTRPSKGWISCVSGTYRPASDSQAWASVLLKC